MLFQGLFQGFRISSHLVGILIVIAGALIALTGGLAINAFARAYGIPFLGMPRSGPAAHASEARQPLAGPALLAGACVFLGDRRAARADRARPGGARDRRDRHPLRADRPQARP